MMRVAVHRGALEGMGASHTADQRNPSCDSSPPPAPPQGYHADVYAFPWNDGDPCSYQFSQNPPLGPVTAAFVPVTSPRFTVPAGAGWIPPAGTQGTPSLSQLLQNPSAYPQFASVVQSYKAAGLPMPAAPAPVTTPTTATAITAPTSTVAPGPSATANVPVPAPGDLTSQVESWLMGSTSVEGLSIPNLVFVGGALALLLLFGKKRR